MTAVKERRNAAAEEREDHRALIEDLYAQIRALRNSLRMLLADLPEQNYPAVDDLDPLERGEHTDVTK